MHNNSWIRPISLPRCRVDPRRVRTDGPSLQETDSIVFFFFLVRSASSTRAPLCQNNVRPSSTPWSSQIFCPSSAPAPHGPRVRDPKEEKPSSLGGPGRRSGKARNHLSEPQILALRSNGIHDICDSCCMRFGHGKTDTLSLCLSLTDVQLAPEFGFAITRLKMVLRVASTKGPRIQFPPSPSTSGL